MVITPKTAHRYADLELENNVQAKDGTHNNQYSLFFVVKARYEQYIVEMADTGPNNIDCVVNPPKLPAVLGKSST